MSSATQQAITQVLQQDSKLFEGLIIKIKQIKLLNNIMREHLDAKLALHCEVANLDEDCLVVITKSAIWATQFRFQIPTLLPLLKKKPSLRHLHSVVCKIQPKTIKHQEQELPHTLTKPIPRLSLAAADTICEAAKTIRYKPLQSIMLKIAKNI